MKTKIMEAIDLHKDEEDIEQMIRDELELKPDDIVPIEHVEVLDKHLPNVICVMGKPKIQR